VCGIAGILNLRQEPVPGLAARLRVMNTLQAHRGPDGEGLWCHINGHFGLAHRRLSIIDLKGGQQPMTDGHGNWVVFNGEIYNYRELRDELGVDKFTTTSDTEVILLSYLRWGRNCVKHFRGMFAFALWDEERGELFCVRDRFGIKPFYYTQVGDCFYFASETKALLPFLSTIETDVDGLKDYLAFQFCLAGKTLFHNIYELLPGHFLTIRGGVVQDIRYWEVFYHLDLDHTSRYFEGHLKELLEDSVRIHLVSDVPVGTYVSGGLDSSVVAALACRSNAGGMAGFSGRFDLGTEYDESSYAHDLAKLYDIDLHVLDINVDDFLRHIEQIIYHLDYPVAGPGSFPQYMLSALAARSHKVVLGGQGGDEIFGGYTRYLIAYFEQCIKAAIDGTLSSGNFIVTYESIIPNLSSLRRYKPMLQDFWHSGLFEEMDKRYFRLINRLGDLGDEIRWDALGTYSPFETFRTIFHGDNVGKQAYFDLMTHFDFKTLLPALLQVEDRVSMAHGLESRVPLLDHHLVEFAATIPANIKFKNGTMKNVFKNVCSPYLPRSIIDRTDKMGFPTPFIEWIRGPARNFFLDILSSKVALTRPLIDNRVVMQRLTRENKFGRALWGFLCLELWQRSFHDRTANFKQTLKQELGRSHESVTVR